MKKSMKRVQIALNLQELDTPGLVSLLRSIVKGFNGPPPNINFTGPELAKLPVTTADILVQATNLEATHTTRLTNKSESLTSLEQEQATLAMNTIGDTAAFVEGLANKKAAGDVPMAVQIITSVGFKVKKEFVSHQRSFEVVKTKNNTAEIRVKANKTGTIYCWRWTATPNDVNSWKVVHPTIECNITITSLPHATTVYFSYAEVMPLGRKPVTDSETFVPNWSDPISAVII